VTSQVPPVQFTVHVEFPSHRTVQPLSQLIVQLALTSQSVSQPPPEHEYSQVAPLSQSCVQVPPLHAPVQLASSQT
jgi:hypothetical protein